jgi:hypothetical protein
MSAFGYDANGLYKRLPGGRVLRVQQRSYNTLLTLSLSLDDQCWEHGW